MNTNSTSTRQAHLDGIRAIAAMAVVAYHAALPGFKGGFIGVDIFFVLSGFLISGIVTRALRIEGEFSFRQFLVQRSVRLLPALLIMLFVAWIISVAFSKWPTRDLTIDAVLAAFYLTNIVRAAGLHEPNLVFGHSWSLGIEQQFYLLWPILAIGVARLFGNINLKVVTTPIVVALMSMILALVVIWWRQYMIATGASLERVYFGPDTHLDGILFGCALGAFLVDRQLSTSHKRMLAICRWPSVFVIVVVFFLAKHKNPSFYIWLLPFLNITACLLLIDLKCNQASALHRLLSTRLLSYLGLISYGVYLWHYPIFNIALDAGLRSSIVLFTFGGGLSIFLAHISYKYFEIPIKRMLAAHQVAPPVSKPFGPLI